MQIATLRAGRMAVDSVPQINLGRGKSKMLSGTNWLWRA